MEQTNNYSDVENTTEYNNKENNLKQNFQEHYLTTEELNNIKASIKRELLASLGFNPSSSAYLQPRNGQVDECNNPLIGDGLLRMFIINTNKIIYSLNKDSGISEPPKSF